MRKITTLLTLLLLCGVGAQADLRVDFGWEYGTYYKKGKQANYPGSQFDKTIASASSQYCNKWISADSYGTNLTVQYGDGGTGSGSTTENNFEMNTNAFCTGSSCHTVNISVADGYEITGYVIKGTAREGSVTVTPAAGGDAVTFTTGTSVTLTVSGLSTTSTSFVVSGDNKYVDPTEFYFTVKKLPQTIQWESYPGWVRNNVASVWWVGITTPGTTSNTYKMSDFQFCQETGYGAAERYACISKTGPTSAGAVLAESDVLGVSTNSVTATAQEYYTYQLADEIELTGPTIS